MGHRPLWAHNLPPDELAALLAEGIVAKHERDKAALKLPGVSP
jgi:hypothetical protein